NSWNPRDSCCSRHTPRFTGSSRLSTCTAAAAHRYACTHTCPSLLPPPLPSLSSFPSSSVGLMIPIAKSDIFLAARLVLRRATWKYLFFTMNSTICHSYSDRHSTPTHLSFSLTHPPHCTPYAPCSRVTSL